MPRSVMFVIDLAAISLVVFGLYFPRHRRKDLVVAYLGVNIGVLAVADVLNASDIGTGLGLGLFGALSIIRLRSAELDQEEVAYYFAALSLGLLGGLSVEPDWVTPALMAAIVAVLYVGDHPKLFAGYRTQVIVVDGAITDETALRELLEQHNSDRVHRLRVRKIDMVKNTTIVEVRSRTSRKRTDDASPNAAPVVVTGGSL